MTDSITPPTNPQDHDADNGQHRLLTLEAQAQAAWLVLDDYKTFLCCLDKPDLVQMTRDVLGVRTYTSSTPNRCMIGHLMTAKRRELGYEDLLDTIDELKVRLAHVGDTAHA